MWQGPKRKVSKSDPVWYDNMALGKDTLENAMKTLSSDAELSYPYTNHCMRHTTTTNLGEAGFEARHIMAVTGHRSERSIKNYSRKASAKKKRKMSETLAKNLTPAPPPPKKQKSTIVTSNEETIAEKTPQVTLEKQKEIPEKPIQYVEQPNPPQLQDQNVPSFNIIPLEPDFADDLLESENFLQAIERIEKENMHPVPQNGSPNLVLTQNVQNSIAKPQTPPFIPAMNFNNSSNITINFHYGYK